MYEVDALSDLRTAVKNALEAGMVGVVVLDYTDPRFTTPAAIVAPSQPYIVTGATFNSFVVRVDVMVLPGKGTSAGVAMEMDNLVISAVHALKEYDLVEVSAPDLLTIGSGNKEQTYWGTIITLEFQTTIKEVI